jgi:hypothetical protein
MKSPSYCSSSRAEVCRVGYALNSKKLRRAASVRSDGKDGKISNVWRGGGLADILEIEPDMATVEELVQFALWDAEMEPDQPYFHVIIHKLTEDIDRVESIAKLKALDAYLTQHPSTIIVDPIAAVQKVVNRARTCQHLRSIETKLGAACPFSQPKFIIVNKEKNDEDVLKELAIQNMVFPLICKPLEACGTPNSHSMVQYSPMLIICLTLAL